MSFGRRSSPAACRALVASMMIAAAAAGNAQTTGDSGNGQTLFNNNSCTSCHSLATQRTQIINRAPNPGTLTFAKAFAALDAALKGTDLDGSATGMDVSYGALTAQQRADIAAYIAGLEPLAPRVVYAPTGGPSFPATMVGSSSTATVTISNTGTANLVFATNNAVTIATGGDTADFRVTSSTCPAATLQPNTGSCTINVTFQPQTGTNPTRTASLGLTTMTGTSLVPMTGIVGSGGGTTPPTNPGTPTTPPAPTPPASSDDGGGGALPALWLMLVGGLALLRRRHVAA